MKTRACSGSTLELSDRLVDEIWVGDPIGANIERACGGRDAFRSFASSPRSLRPHARRLFPEIDAHELGSDRGKEPDQRRRSDEVGHGIGDGDIVDQRGPFRLRQREALNRLARLCR